MRKEFCKKSWLLGLILGLSGKPLPTVKPAPFPITVGWLVGSRIAGQRGISNNVTDNTKGAVLGVSRLGVMKLGQMGHNGDAAAAVLGRTVIGNFRLGG